MATIDVTERTFEETVAKEGTVLIDAWATWCGPCRAFAPVFEKASERHPEVVFGKLNTETNQDLAGALEIQAIPTLLAFRDGILVYRGSGALRPDALDDLLEQVGNLDMDEVRRQVAEQEGGGSAG